MKLSIKPTSSLADMVQFIRSRHLSVGTQVGGRSGRTKKDIYEDIVAALGGSGADDSDERPGDRRKRFDLESELKRNPPTDAHSAIHLLVATASEDVLSEETVKAIIRDIRRHVRRSRSAHRNEDGA